MIIRLEETRSWQAAQQIKEILKERGGNWLVWITDGEGTFLCKAECRHADIMLKYWSDVVAGVFSHDAPTNQIAKSMGKCRWQSAGGFAKAHGTYPRGAALNRKLLKEIRMAAA
jgi:hypothetical protein